MVKYNEVWLYVIFQNRKGAYDMSYMALYRKFRPTRFSEVKGQDHIVKTLENQMRTGRIGHAYLFVGQEVLVRQQ